MVRENIVTVLQVNNDDVSTQYTSPRLREKPRKVTAVPGARGKGDAPAHDTNTHLRRKKRKMVTEAMIIMIMEVIRRMIITMIMMMIMKTPATIIRERTITGIITNTNKRMRSKR